jgi:hypothetical protein
MFMQGAGHKSGAFSVAQQVDASRSLEADQNGTNTACDKALGASAVPAV